MEIRRCDTGFFPYGGAIRLEAPQAFVEEPRQWLKDALAALGPRPAEISQEGPDRCGEEEVAAACSAASASDPSATAGRGPLQATPLKRQRQSPTLSALQRPLGATGATVVDGLGSERTLAALHQHGNQQFFGAGCRAEGVQ